MHEVRPASRAEDAGDAGTADETGSGIAQVGRERPLSFEVEHAHGVAGRGLPADLRQEVHLGAADVERGDHVEDPQAISR